MMRTWCIRDASKFGRWDYTLPFAALPAGTKYFLGEDLAHERQRKPPPYSIGSGLIGSSNCSE
jgi:hypothetical protein